MTDALVSLIDGVAGERIPVTDRGLQYGDGLFESMVCRAGEPQWFSRHWTRLVAGCERLQIKPPEQALLREEIRQLCRDMRRCVVKLIYTRGSASRGYRPSGRQYPTRILTCYPWIETPDAAFHVCTSTVRLGSNALLAGIKHLNRLDSVMAQQQLADTSCAEAIMLSPSGLVVSGSMSNVFVIQEDALLTPALTEYGVCGVMRSCVLQACEALGIRVQVSAITPAMLARASALMVTNVRLGLQPVDTCDARPLRRDARVEMLSRWIQSHA